MKDMDLLERIYETSPVGIGLHDGNLRYLKVNAVLAEINGLSIEEHIGKTVTEVIPRLAHIVEPLLLEVLATGKSIHNIEIQGTTLAAPEHLRHWVACYYPVDLGNGERGVGSVVTEVTELKNAQASLLLSRARLEFLLTSSPAVIFTCIPHGDYRATFMSENVRDILGYEAHEFLDDPLFWLNHLHPDDRQPILDNLPKILETGFYCHEYRFLHCDHTYHWFYAQLRLVRDEQGIPKTCVGYWVDISDRKLAEIRQQQLQEELEVALSEEQQLATITLNSISDAVIVTNARKEIIFMNPRAETLCDCTIAEAKDKAISDVLTFVEESDDQPLGNPIDYILAEHPQPQRDSIQVLVAKNGKRAAVETSAALMIDKKNNNISGAVLVIRDVTQSRMLTNKLSWQANHDALTGLINRQYFEEKLLQAITSIHQENHHHVLCYLDLDRFKLVNDTCGHLAGDELLKQVVRIIQSKIRALDSLARLGGDEFAIILYQCPLNDAISIIQQVIISIQQFRFIWDDKYFSIGVSIGLVELNYDVSDISEILKAADSACYLAKERGGNRLEVYNPDSSVLIDQQQQKGWSIKIRQALDDNRFCLFRQQIIPNNLDQSQLQEKTHYEILLRMVDESGELIYPHIFLPSAERYGLISEIDRWVVNRVLTVLAKNRSPCSLYFINLSAKSLDDEQFLLFLSDQLEQFQIPPDQLGFEITETAAIANITQACELIKILKQKGCLFALDDFGDGVSSFAYLKELPIDFLKIDGFFIKNIVDDPTNLAIVQAINQVGHVMKLKTIAEFVENEEIINKLAIIGIDYLQGNAIAMPEMWANGE